MNFIDCQVPDTDSSYPLFFLPPLYRQMLVIIPVHNDFYTRFVADTSRYPLQDRYGDPYTYPNRNTFDLKDTGFVKRTIEYDPKTKQYYIVEKIGNKYYRTPTSFSMDEFVRMQGKKDEEDYFKKRVCTSG